VRFLSHPRIMDAVLFRARTHQIDDIQWQHDAAIWAGGESECLSVVHSEKNAGWVKQELQAWKPRPRNEDSDSHWRKAVAGIASGSASVAGVLLV